MREERERVGVQVLYEGGEREGGSASTVEGGEREGGGASTV